MSTDGPCSCDEAIALRAEITELNGTIDAIVNEPVSMLLAQAAGLVRLAGPDDWPADAIPRPPVVDMAMRVKDAADMQRTIARDRAAQRAGGRVTTLGILRKAREVIVTRGWWQGGFMPEVGDPKTCPVCAVGAINVAISGKPRDSRCVDDFDPYEALCMAVGLNLPDWNDAPGRTVDEILAAFDRAIEAEAGK